MGLVVLRHGEDGDHGDGAIAAYTASGTLVNGCQVGVEVAGIAAAARNLFLCGGNLTQGLGIVGDIGHDNQYMHALFEG